MALSTFEDSSFGAAAGDDDQSVGSLGSSLRKALAEPDPQGGNQQRRPQAGDDDDGSAFNPHSTLSRRDDRLQPGDFDLDDDQDGRQKQPPTPHGAAVDPLKNPPNPAVPNNGDADVFAVARELGMDLSGKYKTPRDAIRGLVEGARLVGQRNDKAAFYDKLNTDESIQRQVFERLSQKFAPIPAPPTQQPSAAQPRQQQQQQQVGPPKFDPRWRAHFDANGTPKPNADPNVVAAVQQWQEEKRRWDEDPMAYLQPAIAKEAERLFNEQMERSRQEQQQREQEAIQRQIQAESEQADRAEGYQLLSQEYPWVYENGDPNKPYTEHGQLFADKLSEALSLRLPSGHPRYPHHADRIAYAKNAVIQAYRTQVANQGADTRRQADPRLNRTPGTPTTQPNPNDEPDPTDLRGALRRLIPD